MDPGEKSFPVTPGELVEVEVTGLAYGGAGIAREDGFVVFVAGALPGDRVRATVERVGRSFAEARAVELVRPSPDRTEAPCPHFGPCGGCQWMDLRYEAQLAAKEGQVRDCLERIGRLERFTLRPIAPSPEIFAYRNKMAFDVTEGEAGVVAGLHHARDPEAIVPLTDCRIQDPRANEILGLVVAACRKAGLRAAAAAREFVRHDPPRAQGGEPGREARLRRIVIRRGARGERFLVGLVTSPGPCPEGRDLARGLIESHPALAGVVRILEAPGGGDAAILPLAGSEALVEEILGLRLSFTGGSFLQTNAPQAARLYQAAMDFAGPSAGDRVLDVYCGVGAMTLLLARDGAEAVGIEGSREAVRCARLNASENGLDARARFIRGEARRTLAGLASEGTRFDLVVLNPPRAGIPAEAADSVARLRPGRIVYVSCNPATLARDVARLTGHGYRLAEAAPFDMFPHTWHIETVARLDA